MQKTPRILVIRRRYLGDVVLLGSLFRNLRLHWPDAHVSALVEPQWAGILALNPDVDTTLTLPTGLAAWPGFIGRIRGGHFTHVLDIDNTEKTALIARLSGAPVRVGLHHGAHPMKLRSLYTHVAYEPEEEHERQPISEYYLKALGPAGVPVATREVRLVPREADILEWRRFVGAQGRPLLVHPGSRSAWRIWPHDRFAAVCDRVQDELGVQVVLVGGPAEAGLIASIRSKARTHLLAVEGPLPLRGSRRWQAPAERSSATTADRCTWQRPWERRSWPSTAHRTRCFSCRTARATPRARPAMPCGACVATEKCVPGDSYHNFCVRLLAVEAVFAAVKAALSAPGA